MSTLLHHQTFIPIKQIVVRKHKLDDTIIEIILVPNDSVVEHEEIVLTVYSGIDQPAAEVINELTS